MRKLVYADISEVTAAITVDLFDIDHAEDGDPGTGTLRGTFPEGAFYQDAISDFTDAMKPLGITVTAEDSDGATVILHLDWRDAITRDRAAEIIAEEGMGDRVGPVQSLTVSDDGRLRDDNAWEAANITSETAFRAQVVAWREACGL